MIVALGQVVMVAMVQGDGGGGAGGGGWPGATFY